DAAEAGDVLLEDVVRRHEHPQHRQRQRVGERLVVLAVGGDAEDQHQRVHQDPLVPAQRAGHEVPDLAEVEAAQRGHDRDQPRRVEERQPHRASASSMALRTLARVGFETSWPSTNTVGVPRTPSLWAMRTSASTRLAVSAPWTQLSSRPLSSPTTYSAARSMARAALVSVFCARSSTGSSWPKASRPCRFTHSPTIASVRDIPCGAMTGKFAK